MFKADLHIHSYKSFDADRDETIINILETAEKRGLGQIALCDHYDVNWVATGENPDIDFKNSRELIDKAKQRIPNSVDFLLGIELGQPHHLPDMSKKVLADNDFDFILCSLHNAREEPDFYYIDYKNMNILSLIRIFEKYNDELCELANWGEYHSLAHITYPVRYFSVNNIHISLKKYYDIYKKLFSILIHRGIALEVNTSGLSKRINATSPSFDLLELYKSMGGELITVGSDAHNLTNIYSGIAYTYECLLKLGFKYICIIKDKKLEQIKIEI